MTPLRAAACVVAAGAAGPPLAVALLALGMPAALGLIGAGLGALGAGVSVARLVPADAALRDRAVLFALWLGLSLVAVGRQAWLSPFMLDADRTVHRYDPPRRPLDDPELARPYFPRHNCFTAYYLGAALARDGAENVYGPHNYRRAERAEPGHAHAAIAERFWIDPYQYPPPFLVLPAALSRVSGGDFFAARALWFALSSLALSLALVTLAMWTGGPSFGAHWLAWPAVMAAPVTHGTLQIGNAHLFVVALIGLALPAFATRRPWLGGPLLGFAIVAKMFPAALLVWLAARRRWSDLAWTAAAVAAYALASVALFGPGPWRWFFEYHLQRLAGGSAFLFAKIYAHPILTNVSAMSVPYTLEEMGLRFDTPFVATWITRAWGLAVLVLLAAGGMRAGGAVTDGPARRRTALAWMAGLVLAQSASPFLPWGYANLAVLWLLALAAARPGGGALRAAVFAGLWLALAVNLPLPLGPRSIGPDLAFTLIATVGVMAWSARVVLEKKTAES